jgi:hypothetical protein
MHRRAVNTNLNSTGTVDSELDGTLVGVKQLDLGLGWWQRKFH